MSSRLTGTSVSRATGVFFDKAGTPFCLTIDTLKDQTVTIRERDTLKQRRIPLAPVADELHKLLQP
jgi:glycyl-tRNA synthetase